MKKYRGQAWRKDASEGERPMDQMNVSITDEPSDYVRKKVRSRRYNNASEVVREALRRMEDMSTAHCA